MINKNKLGLALGLFFALLHLVWAISVGIGLAESFINWVMPLHFIALMIPITTFSFLNAIILIIIAFVAGYVSGWVFAALWNWVGKKK